MYDTLERVRDSEMVQRDLQRREGWLGESEERPEMDDGPKMIELQDMASSWQFKEAQGEDEELQELQTLSQEGSTALHARTAMTYPRLKVRHDLLYQVQ